MTQWQRCCCQSSFDTQEPPGSERSYDRSKASLLQIKIPPTVRTQLLQHRVPKYWTWKEKKTWAEMLFNPVPWFLRSRPARQAYTFRLSAMWESVATLCSPDGSAVFLLLLSFWDSQWPWGQRPLEESCWQSCLKVWAFLWPLGFRLSARMWCFLPSLSHSIPPPLHHLPQIPVQNTFINSAD